MKNKIMNIVFSIVFMTILVVPTLCMNTKKAQVSEIDNKILTEWPKLTISTETRDQIEEYFADRIGFREQAIDMYINGSDKLFHVMVHPLFMYGKEGHIYYKDPYYIAAYQRLNTNEEFLDSFVDYLDQTKQYLDGRNIRFLYFLCPDKKTIYPEFFPESIHVNEDNKTIPQYIEEKISQTDVDYFIPIQELTEAKKEKVVYNKLYDATHWNEFGAFVGHSLIDQKMQQWFEDVPPFSEEDFQLTFTEIDTLDVAKFPIKEEVPVYTLKNDQAGDMTEYLLPSLDKCLKTTTFYSHYVNPEAPNNRVLLVFTDSYFGNYQRYYTNRFKEVYFVHRQNYEYLQYMVNLTFPDVVIFETAERSISSEMELLSDFNNLYYEPAYDGKGEPTSSDTLGIELTQVSGVRAEGNKLYLNPEAGESIVSLTGVLTGESCEQYDVYALVDGNYLETDYLKLHLDAMEQGSRLFSVNIQRRYLQEQQIELIAVEKETKTQVLLETFEVVYGE